MKTFLVATILGVASALQVTSYTNKKSPYLIVDMNNILTNLTGIYNLELSYQITYESKPNDDFKELWNLYMGLLIDSNINLKLEFILVDFFKYAVELNIVPFKIIPYQ